MVSQDYVDQVPTDGFDKINFFLLSKEILKENQNNQRFSAKLFETTTFLTLCYWV